MAEVDSDEERQLQDEETARTKKPTYTKATRILSDPQHVKKQKTGTEVNNELNPDEIEYEDDEEYYQKLMESKKEEKVDDMDILRMQLELEKEEAERKLKEPKSEEKPKTRIDEDGTEYEWDPLVKGWFPKVSINKLIEYQQGYQNPNAASYSNIKEDKFYLFNGGFFKWNATDKKWVNSDMPVYEYIDYLTGIEYEWNAGDNQWKAKNAPPQVTPTTSTTTPAPAATAKPVEKKQPKKEGWFQIDDEKNTNVYVSGLPLDITDQEFEDIMSKYGIIMKDPLTHKLKCKLYKENGEVKGDGRCCYLMPESVKLCLQLLDGSDYRGKKVKVEKAKFELKGSYDPSKSSTNEVQKKKLSKIKEKKLLEKQRQKLLDWEDRPEIVRQKHEKVVVIKNIFSLDDAENDKSFAQKLRDDLKSELEHYGDIKKILVHERNPEGVVTVSFREVEQADSCCEFLDNRVWKNGRIISCQTWDGEARFDQEETEEERERRINEWHRFLESDD